MSVPVILGIETSCDDTGVGIVTGADDPSQRIRAHIVASQIALHRPYGGVVPEIAARAHLDVMQDCIAAALAEAGLSIADLTAVAATSGPGLIGGVMIGAVIGKAIAAARGLPFIAINHLEAHALTPRLTETVAFPYLLLLASGGHCQLLEVQGVGRYRVLGGTIDDAIGECFDKGAKLLGLGYPGGPLIEQAARNGDPTRVVLPRPLLGRAGCDFSFSGLKTAVRLAAQAQALTPSTVADLAASLQAGITDCVADRVGHAFAMLDRRPSALVVAGGVAANQSLRARLQAIAATQGVGFAAPPVNLCTDNGVMIAWAGLERYRLGLTDGYDTGARPRWPLDTLSPPDISVQAAAVSSL